MHPSIVGGGGTWNTTDGKSSELTGGTPPQVDLVGASITILWVQCIQGCLLDAKTQSYDLEADVGLVNIAPDS